MRSGVFLFKKISQIFLILINPLQKIFYFIFKKIILPLYNLLYSFKKKLQSETENSSDNKIILLLANRHLIYTLVIILSAGILINNFTISSAAAEDLGKKSLLYKIVQGDEFEEIIEEKSVIIEKSTKENPDIKQDLATSSETLETTSLNIEKTTLTLTEKPREIDVSNLQETTVAQGLAAETISKTGSIATLSAPKPKSEILKYAVESGDTVSSIAKKFQISINTILWANDLSGLSIIRPSDKLTILPISGVVHKVKKDDTISAIAKKYNVEQDAILSYNQLVNNDQLSIGQVLIVPDGEIQQIYQRTPSGFASVFKPPSSQKKAGGFIWPTVSRSITQYYHWRHNAIDIGAKTGSPIYASMAGKIIKAGWSEGYGYNVIIDHGGGKKTLYAHLSKIYAQNNDQITQGSVIGAIGSTGWSTGPHLHFEIIINGTKVNPLSYL